MSASSRRGSRGSAARRRAVLRRRLVLLLSVAAVVVVAVVVIEPIVHRAVREITLPLRHEDIIRQQAREKGLDPALLAAVIYTESHFRNQTSAAGAKGLMQITPATAQYIEHLSGGRTFEVGDLGTPQINISYGSYYLHYLLAQFNGSEVLALAAYNGGETNVQKWVGKAAAEDRAFQVSDIPFPETRTYVSRVEKAKGEYASTYAKELGLR